MSPQLQTILQELRQRLEELYGERLDRLVLFGSQARGDAEPDSDIDVLVVLKGEVKPFEESNRVTEITAEISLDYNVVISCVYASNKRFTEDNTSLFRNVRSEGIRL